MASPHEDAEHLPLSPSEAESVDSSTALTDRTDGGESAKPRLNGHRLVENGNDHSDASGEEDDDDSEEEEDDGEDDGEESEEEEDDDDEPALKYERITGAIPELLKKDSASALAISHNIMACRGPPEFGVTNSELLRRHSELMPE